MGFEPTTLSLARRCSTTEPLPLNRLLGGFSRWCRGLESNQRHEDFQSTALPLSYLGPMLSGYHCEYLSAYLL